MSNTVILNSKWQSLNDYISADAYNKLKSDILTVSTARGMLKEDNGVYTNTLTKSVINIPNDKNAGDVVYIQDINDLQDIAKNTVAYNDSEQTSVSENKIDDEGNTYKDTLQSSYDYKDPNNISKPLALLYNEVRQVVVDIYAGAGCANSCSTACKSACSQTCYEACTTGCNTENACYGSCGNNCNTTCYNNGCTQSCGNGCTDTCKMTCTTNCSASGCAQNSGGNSGSWGGTSGT